VPVGPDIASVAAKVTACPNALGFCDEVRVVVVVGAPTVWMSGAEVLGENVASPL
jgi:hypothetical protein